MPNQEEQEHTFTPGDFELDQSGNLVFKNVTPELKRKLEDMLKDPKWQQPGQNPAAVLKVTAIG